MLKKSARVEKYNVSAPKGTEADLEAVTDAAIGGEESTSHEAGRHDVQQLDERTLMREMIKELKTLVSVQVGAANWRTAAVVAAVMDECWLLMVADGC